MIGDFDDLIYEHEKDGGMRHRLLEGFRDVVNECGLSDLRFVGNEFTWKKSRRCVTWVQEHLDRGCANQGWRNLFTSAEIKVLEVSIPDHLLLLLELK